MKLRLYFIAGLLLLQFASLKQVVYANEISDYQQELDIYRSLYQTYTIKLREFQQFGTNTSEEDFIKAARDMLLARADTWIGYWKMLLIETQPLTSLQESTKSDLLESYTNEMTWLSTHKQQLVAAERRDTLAKEAARLNLKMSDYQVLATEGTALLYTGRLQTVTLQLLQLNDALTQRVQNQQLGDDVKQVKLRGLSVNKDRLSIINQELTEFENNYSQKSGASSETIDIIKIKLDPISTTMRQLRQVLAELAEGVEW